MASRSAVHGSSRATTSGWCVPTIVSRWSREIRARNVTSARVAASARWRSSRTSTTGCRSPSRPSRPRIALEGPRLAPFGTRSGRPRRSGRRAPSRRGPRSGRSRTTSDVAGPSRSAQHVVGQVEEGRADGPDDRPVRLVRVGGPGRRAQDGHRVAQRLDPDDRLVEEAGDADARPCPRGGASASGRARRHRGSAASWANAASRPTKRALVYVTGMRHSRARAEHPTHPPSPAATGHGRVG